VNKSLEEQFLEIVEHDGEFLSDEPVATIESLLNGDSIGKRARWHLTAHFLLGLHYSTKSETDTRIIDHFRAFLVSCERPCEKLKVGLKEIRISDLSSQLSCNSAGTQCRSTLNQIALRRNNVPRSKAHEQLDELERQLKEQSGQGYVAMGCGCTMGLIALLLFVAATGIFFTKVQPHGEATAKGWRAAIAFIFLATGFALWFYGHRTGRPDRIDADKKLAKLATQRKQLDEIDDTRRRQAEEKARRAWDIQLTKIELENQEVEKARESALAEHKAKLTNLKLAIDEFLDEHPTLEAKFNRLIV